MATRLNPIPRTLFKILYYLFLIFTLIFTLPFDSSADTNVSGQISTDTTWTLANSPYIVTGSVLVKAGVTLTIAPGVTVKFNENKALQVDGQLIARGTSTQNITFTTNTSGKYWGYILFPDSSTDATCDNNGNYVSGSILQYCILEYAGGANGAVRAEKSSPCIDHCTIRNNQANGIFASEASNIFITNNVVTNNTGYGIYNFGGTGTIKNNTITNNTGGGVYPGSGRVTITDNNITNNIYAGISDPYNSTTITNNTVTNNTGGGIYGGETISNNIVTNNTGGGISNGYIIINNIVTNNTGGGIGASYNGTVSNNIVTNNTGGGIYGGTEVAHNTILNNTTSTPGNGAGLNYGGGTIINNTIIYNRTSVPEGTGGCSLSSNSTLNSNNIYGNDGYAMYCNVGQGTNIDATNNYWGTTNETAINDLIYDWFDDSSKGMVEYSPYLTSHNTDAPISPPTGFTATAGTNSITLTWSANPESDTAGYKIYWDTNSGYPYANSADVGNITSYTITDLATGTYYVTVTAYDTSYSSANDDPSTIVNDNQTSGNESWYAEEKSITLLGCTVSITPPSANVVSNSSQNFSASTSGTSCNPATYTWSLSSSIGSTITESGVYTAGFTCTQTTDTVTVTDTANGNIAGTATVTVIPPTCTVSITPSSVTKSRGSTQTFTASTSGTGCKTGAYTWSVSSSIGSTINSNGVYTAGSTSTQATDTITVTDTANCNITSQATVTVTLSTATITCSVTPSSLVFGNSVTVGGTITPPQSDFIDIVLTAPSTAQITQTALSNSNGTFQMTYQPDAAGTWYVKAKYGTAESSQTSFTVTKAPTTLTCNVNPPAIRLGETVDLSGSLTPSPNAGLNLSELTISLSIITPDGQVKETKTVSTNQYGQYTLNKYAGLNETGTWEIHASFNGNSNYNSSTSTCEVTIQETAGYAILIEGKLSGSEEGQDGYNKTLNGVYDQLINRSFSSDDIYYFNYQIPQDGVDATTTKSGIEWAITNWAKDKMNQKPAPLYIVLIDHGDQGKFYIDSYTITPSELDNWVTTLETGLTGSALGQEIIIIYGACYSGSFIDDLSEVGRFIISSAAPNEQSYKGPKDKDGIRDGEYFVTEFFNEAGKGKNLKEAFETATQRTEAWTMNKGCPQSGYYDNACQHPLLDDNGDKKGSNDLSTGGDGKVAENLVLGIGTNAGEPIEIIEVSPSIILSSTQTTPTLWAKVSDSSRVDTIWVEIKPPGYQPPASTGEVEQDLPTCTYTNYNSTLDRYEWNTTPSPDCNEFIEAGTYEVFYFAKDRYTGEISPFLKTIVYKETSGNQPPSAFNLLSPEDKEEVKTTLILDWEDSVDPEGEEVTYTVEIAEDANFTTISYKKEGLLYSTCGIDDTAGLEDMTTYYWRVVAFDPYGGKTLSNKTFIFTTNNTNFIPGLITGYLVDASTSDFIPYAEVETDTGGAGIAVGGYYLMTVPAGICTVTASATGYSPAAQAGVEVNGGDTITVNLSLSGGGATTWNNVIEKYNDYVSGNADWDDVIATYQAYVGG